MHLEAPHIGQRVRLVRPYAFDPQGEIPVGATGTVVENVSGVTWRIFIKLDEDCVKNLKVRPEDDIISFYVECGPQEYNGCLVECVITQFHLTCDCLHPILQKDIEVAA